jgi:hypothetical protein
MVTLALGALLVRIEDLVYRKIGGKKVDPLVQAASTNTCIKQYEVFYWKMTTNTKGWKETAHLFYGSRPSMLSRAQHRGNYGPKVAV